MVVKYTKPFGREVHIIDLEQLDEMFDKKEIVYGTDRNWMSTKRRIITPYSTSWLKKFLKSMRDFECDKTKDEILAEIKNPKMFQIWQEYDTHK